MLTFRIFAPSAGALRDLAPDRERSAAPVRRPRPDVMIFLPQFGSGGVERVACLVANGLAESGLRVRLASIDADGPVRCLLSPAVDAAPLDAPRLGRGLPRTMKIALALPALTAAIRRERPKVLLSPGNHAHPAVVLAHAMAGRPEVRLALKLTNPIARQGRGRAETRLLTLLYGWMFGRADRVLVLSRDGVGRAEEMAPGARGRVAFVHNPYVPAHTESKAARPPEGAPLVLAVGRLSTQKNLGLLLTSLARIKDRPWRLAILGTGPHRERLEAQALALGVADRVRFEGFVTDPGPYYRRAHLLALPSLWEDLPAVALEALAAGCPVLATDCSPALTEVLARSGHGEAVSEATFGDALSRALERPFTRAGQGAAAAYGVSEGVADHLAALAPLIESGSHDG